MSISRQVEECGACLELADRCKCTLGPEPYEGSVSQAHRKAVADIIKMCLAILLCVWLGRACAQPVCVYHLHVVVETQCGEPIVGGTVIGNAFGVQPGDSIPLLHVAGSGGNGPGQAIYGWLMPSDSSSCTDSTKWLAYRRCP